VARTTRTRKTPARRGTAAPAKRAAVAGSEDGPTSAIAAEARLIRVEPGLHSLTIAATTGAAREAPRIGLPAVLVAAAPPGIGPPVELIGATAGGAWIGAEGGTVMLRGPAVGGHVLLTSYGPQGRASQLPRVELRPIAVATAAGAVLRAEIVLHIEREGDRQFTSGGWAGRLGSRQRVEALALRPLEVISRGDVEYKVYGTGGRETPWVSDGRLCGTRGQGMPLTGFAIRIAPHLRDAFDVIYRGAFFASGPAPAVRNGEACFAPLRDDPLEAVEIRIVERGGAR